MNSRTLILLVMAIIIATLMVVMVKNREHTPVASGQKVLVAVTDILPGSFIRADKNLAWVEWPEASISPTFITPDKHKLEEFNGGVARNAIGAGEPISISSIVRANEGGFMSAVLSEGMRAVSIAVNSTSGNAGFIFPGDRVDLILTHRIEDVRVLAIDQMLANPDNKAVIAKTITLEVTPKQAEEINVAISIGTISVSLRSLANDSPKAHVATPNSEGNYSTNSDVSKLMGDKTVGGKVSVYHGTTTEQLDFHEGRK